MSLIDLVSPLVINKSELLEKRKEKKRLYVFQSLQNNKEMLENELQNEISSQYAENITSADLERRLAEIERQVEITVTERNESRVK